MQILHSGPYDYQGLGGLKAHCQLWVGATDLHVFVLAKELPDNPGTSVTNAADELRSQVCQDYALAKGRVRWFEWYDHHQDMGLAFTEYLPTESRWRPSHAGDREILMTMINSPGAGVSG
jgi:hypothetical protein